MRTKREFFLALFFLTAVALAVTYPILRNIENWGIEEWDIEAVDIAIQVDTILIFHQIPLWTPYKSGGTFVLAKPLSMFLSPFFIFPLIAGPVVGMKISIIAHLIFGLVAMYALARYLGMGVISSSCAAILFFLNTRFSLYLNNGNFEYLAQAFFPAVFLFYLRFLNEPAHRARYLFWGAAFSSLVFLDGAAYYYVYLFVLLAVFTCVSYVTGRRGLLYRLSGKRIIFSFLFFVLLAFSFSAVKLLPSAEIQLTNPRITHIPGGGDSGYPLKVLANALMTRNQKLRTGDGEKRRLCPSLAFKEGKYRIWEEYGAYIGPVPIALYVISLFLFFRKKRDLVFASLLFLMFSIAHIGPVNLWAYLHRLPVFNTMRCPTRFIIFFFFFLSLLAGGVLDIIERKGKGRVIVLACTLFILGDMIGVNRPLYEKMFSTPPRKHERPGAFHQIQETGRQEKYVTYLSNKGVIRAYSHHAHPRNALSIEDADYRGEAYLLRPSGKVRITHFSPNRVLVSVDSADRDLLVLNQNYDRGWRAKGSITGRASKYRGLVAAGIDGTTEEVAFYYSPLSFRVGLFITLFAYGIFGLYFVRRKIRARKP